jgi:hypothetical protein
VDKSVEHQVLVDLVGDRQQVVLDAQGGDCLELLQAEHGAGRVVRRVDQDGARPGRHGGAQGVDVQRQAARRVLAQADGHARRAGHGHGGGVRVVVRLDQDHLVAGLDQRQQRGRDRLGGTDGHQDLGVRVVREPVPRTVRGDGAAQHRHAGAGRVLVHARPDRRLGRREHRRRAIGVGEALTEVDGVVLHGQRRHLREDGRRERLQPRN